MQNKMKKIIIIGICSLTLLTGCVSDLFDYYTNESENLMDKWEEISTENSDEEIQTETAFRLIEEYEVNSIGEIKDRIVYIYDESSDLQASFERVDNSYNFTTNVFQINDKNQVIYEEYIFPQDDSLRTKNWYTYNENGTVETMLSITEMDGIVHFEPYMESYEYNSQGQLIKSETIIQNGNESETQGNVIYFSYDSSDNLIEESCQNSLYPGMEYNTYYEYDGNKLIKSTEVRSDRVYEVTYTYEGDLLVSEQTYESKFDQYSFTSYEYDEAGNIVKDATNYDSLMYAERTYTHDEFGNVLTRGFIEPFSGEERIRYFLYETYEREVK